MPENAPVPKTTESKGTTVNDRTLLLRTPGGRLHLGDAPVPEPGPGEIVVAGRALAVNPIDAMGGLLRRVALPWLRYPAVLGSDVAGEVVAVGPGVSSVAPGDRVVAYAVGVERSRNDPAEGAFRTRVKVLASLTAPIPPSMSFEEACVLPLALTTAAAGLFEPDQLALALPSATPSPRNETLLVLGGATSVGMNAVQLARNAGYAVVATASARNADLLRDLGVDAVVDYHDGDVVEQLARILRDRPLAGTIAVAAGSLGLAIAVNRVAGVTGSGRIASAHPTPDTRIRGALARRRGLHVSAIWGGSPKDSDLGGAIWNGFLPDALADGRYRPAPAATVVGTGLEAVPVALDRLREGASAEKFVVTL
jgi:NADPH:quinone reductase-like Zn-dependent oxidoreductase